MRMIILWSGFAMINGIYAATPCEGCMTVEDVIGHMREHLRVAATLSSSHHFAIAQARGEVPA